jgi:ATP-dependent Zn protease
VTDQEDHPGLSWPDHNTGPMPPPEYQSRERDDERKTRKPLPWWDRVKFLILFVFIWVALVGAAMSNDPLLGWNDAANQQAHAASWVFVLFGLELWRQAHYLLSETWAAYHRFWSVRVFGGLGRRTARINDWTRYRISRTFKVVVVLVLFAVVLGKMQHDTPFLALIHLPGIIWRASPLILQIMFGFFFGVIQFVGIFWFLSRGGTEVYMPDDIKTRFTDVWGQDAVLERVKENVVFLEDPESIEEKGGYVPGGILLWGPPGTGKGQPVSATVMTPAGGRRMGDLVPGDEVIGSGGQAIRVLEVHLLGERDIFKVSFSDGTSLRVTEDHLWQVNGEVRSTADLIANPGLRGAIPMAAPVEFVGRDLPLDPFTLGQIVAGHATFDLDTRTVLKELELYGLPPEEMFVPDDFLWSSPEHRAELLRGLLNDSRRESRPFLAQFPTRMRSEGLAAAVQFLVESLGGSCRVTGDLVEVVPEPRRMLSIEPDGREEARCIKVDAADHLYVTEHFIVTHNTLMAEAVAGETGKPYVFVEPSAFINMFIGVGPLKVKGLFRKLRKLALRYGGVIVFFDEADSLGSRRGAMAPGGGLAPTGFTGAMSACHGLTYMRPEAASLLLQSSSPEAPRRWRDGFFMGGGGAGGGGDMGTLQVLLTELSGLKKPRGFINRVVRRWLGMRPKQPPKYRILVMMATNMPQSLDEALLRPGRIDRIYKVGYPSKPGRVRTYEGYLAKVKHSLSAEEIERLATMTPYATGATIKDMVNEGLIQAIRNGRDTITWKDIIAAKHLKDLGPPEDVEYIDRERHATAIHEACHAVAAAKERHHLIIDLATIEKGGSYLGMVSSIKPEDMFTQWRSEYEADIVVALASLAGERLFFGGDSSSGVSGDLESATTIATFMEGYWGMGKSVTSHGVTLQVGVSGGGRPGGGDEKDKGLLGHASLGGRIEEKLDELLNRAEALLKQHRLEVLAVAHALETNKTLSGDDVMAIIEGREGPLVDGRPYHTKEFEKAAETYHERVMAAHLAHARVDIPMPELASISGNGHHVEDWSRE